MVLQSTCTWLAITTVVEDCSQSSSIMLTMKTALARRLALTQGTCLPGLSIVSKTQSLLCVQLLIMSKILSAGAATLLHQLSNSKTCLPISFLGQSNHSLHSTDPALKKCSFSCPGDVSQACGGDGTYISIYYDRTKYTPGSDSIPGGPSSSSISQSSTSSVSSSPTSSVSTTSVTGTSSSTTATATQTGPAIVQNVSSYSFVGCYTEATTGRALTGKTYANDGMTIEICAATCAGFTWFGVEYRRECTFLSPECS